jgi:hypothetical protein
MTKKERVQLEMSRKTYETITNAEMLEKVRYLESVLQQKLDIWSDDEQYEKFQKINKLNLSDRRLMLVYSILDGSIARTATAFGVNRKTILTNLERIKKEELKLNEHEK